MLVSSRDGGTKQLGLREHAVDMVWLKCGECFLACPLCCSTWRPSVVSTCSLSLSSVVHSSLLFLLDEVGEALRLHVHAFVVALVDRVLLERVGEHLIHEEGGRTFPMLESR